MTMTRTSMPLLWSAILGLVAALGSYGLACVFPFAAIAAIAAITLPTRQALALIGAVWGMNQIVGFTLLSYATGDHAAVWGLVIGAAAVLAYGAARVAAGATTSWLGWVGAIIASITAYQLVMFASASALDGFASSTPQIVATIASNDVLWFAGLAALRIVLGLGLPRRFGTPQPA